MKKILKSVFAIAIAALAFTSCDDVPMPYDTPIANSGGGDASGKGTLEEPFNVAAAIAKCKEFGSTVSTDSYYVKGIVDADATTDTNYNNITFNMVDAEGGEKFKAFQVKVLDGMTGVKKGDEVVVYGPIYNYSGNTPETAGKGAAIIVSYKRNSEETSSGETIGTEDAPITTAEAVELINALEDGAKSTQKAYVKGKIVKIATNAENFAKYGNINYYISDDGTTTNQVQIYAGDGLNGTKFSSVNDIKVGDEVIVFGTLYKFTKSGASVPEITDSYIVKLNSDGGDTPTPQPTGENLLTNGDFEAWTGGLPDNWKPASTAGNATLSQSSDAHGGSYAVSVAHATANKRLGHEEITLKAGTYQASCWVKADDAAGAKISVGYAVVTNGKVSSADDYKYEVKDQMLSNEWSNVTYSFTLSSETTISLLVMVNKTSSANVIVDDYTLTTSNGGLADGNDGDTSSSDVTYTLTTTIANGKYIIAANNSGTYEVATPLSSAYGYIQKSDVTPSGSTIATSSANEFTLTAVTGGYTIQDASGKYYYMTGNYNSFNVQETVPSEGHIWSITVNEDQTVTITNVAKNKTIQYDTQYNSYGAYGETKGIFPNLFKK